MCATPTADNNYENPAAAWTTLIFIFLYAPAYNIGYNALTYSMSSPSTLRLGCMWLDC